MDTLEFESITIKEKLALIKVVTNYALEYSDDDRITGKFDNCHLSSIFQPIFSPIKGEIVGHSAYVRSEPGEDTPLSTWQFFVIASKNDDKLTELNHISRAVHALNYFYKVPASNNLFMTLHPHLLESVEDDHGRMFGHFLSLIGVNTSQVVIEIPAVVNRNWKLLRHVIYNYRSRGYQIAANYSGGSSSDWMAELGNFYPDIVSIQAGDLLRHKTANLLVDSIHHFEAALSVKNIDSPEHVAAALQAGADYLQGNYLGQAERTIKTTILPQISEKFNAERWRQQVL